MGGRRQGGREEEEEEEEEEGLFKANAVNEEDPRESEGRRDDNVGQMLLSVRCCWGVQACRCNTI